MVEENISLEFRLKNIDETRNYFTEDINQNQWLGKKQKSICTTLYFIKHLPILASAFWLVFQFLRCCSRIENLCNSSRN